MTDILGFTILVVATAGTVVSLVRCSWLHASLWAVSGMGVLVVVTVIGMIINDPWQSTKSVMESTKGRMKQIAMKLHMYAEDYDGELPPTLGTILDSYGGGGFSYVTPRSRTPCPQSGQEVDEGRCDLLYFGAGKKLAEYPKDEPLVTTKPILARKAKYACVIYADTHVELYKPVPESLKAWWQQHLEGLQHP